MKHYAILFDLDGTLVNSLSDIAAVINMTRAYHGLPAVANEQVRASIGKGVEFLVQGCFPESPKDQIPEILKKHREIYLAYPHVDGELYPGVLETLTKLRSLPHYKLGVATNKPKKVAVEALQHYLPSIRFDVVAGPEDVSKRKPAREHLLEPLARLQVPPENAFYCGDDPVDFAAASAAGLQFFAAGWGFGGVKLNNSNQLDDISQLLHFLPGVS